MDLLRGPADRQRPARACTTCGPGCSRTSTPASRRCAATTCPARAAGTATACRSSSRSRRRSACTPSTRSRPTASRTSTSTAATRSCATSRTGRRSPPGRARGSTPPTPTGPCRTTTSSRCGGCSRQLWEKGLLYEGHKVSPYCARCGTALSSHEMGQPDVYRDVTDPSVYVRFPLTDGPAADADLLVWTTTPWTLISNVAAAVGPDIDYARVPAEAWGSTGRDLVVAVSRAARGRRADRHLEGPRAGRLALPAPVRPARPAARSQRLAGGRGRLRQHRRRLGHRPHRPRLRRGRRVRRPGRGPAGAQPGRRRRHLRPPRPAVAGPVRQGRRPRHHRRPHRPGPARAPAAVRAQLPALLALRHAAHLLGQDLVVRADLRPCATSCSARTRPSTGSRPTSSTAASASGSRATSTGPCRATATGARRCRSGAAPSCGDDRCFGSVADLAAAAGRDLTDLDLHRPYVDDVTLPCASCSGTARRVAPVLDAWFDSGSMPSAQHHYPFENEDRFDQSFPADFICEAIDQTRGWFYSLLAVNALVFDRTPYRNVVCLNLIVDENGQKMSKSRGNIIPPWDIFSTQGADALRWYFFSVGPAVDAPPGVPRGHPRVDPPDAAHALERDRLLRHLRRPRRLAARSGGHRRGRADARPTCSTAGCWASSTTPSPPSPTPSSSSTRWPAPSRLATFVDDLSNWYVRRSRPRFWKSSDPAAHATLYECLVTTAQLLAPFCPFLADAIYTRLTGETSVHLTDWPEPTGPPRPGPGRPGRRLPPARGAGPGRPHRRQGPGAPAAAPGPCCCTPASSSTRPSRTRS